MPVNKQKGFKLADQRDLPKDNNCGRNHPGECLGEGAVHFKCGKFGHMSRDCETTLKIHCYQLGYFS